jgi:hypothetical protein
MLDWHHRLIGLRRKIPALSDGRLERVAVNFDEQAQWIVMTRGNSGRRLQSCGSSPTDTAATRRWPNPIVVQK